MNSLLKRQIRKFLPEDLANDDRIIPFLKAITNSYQTQEEQFNMLQRAMQISSDELYEANHKLRAESEAQQEILNSLNEVIQTLNLKNLEKNSTIEVIDLANYLKEQSEELQRINKEQERLLKSLEYKNEILSDYAHMVSHDLKSPLRSINTLINFILEDNKDLKKESKEYLDLILNNLEKMDALISGILNYSTLEENHLDNEKIDIKLLLKDIVTSIYIPDHIQIKLENHYPTIKGDKIRIQQLFQNLLQNAVKSIDKPLGIINVEVKSKETFWEFSISDNGKGIPKHQFEKIFKIFEKIDDNQNSTGIGLSIVKKIIDFYGGKIWLESELDKGTTFYFTIKK